MRPSIDQLYEHLSLDAKTGILTWKKPTSNRVRAGSVADRQTHGYLEVTIKGNRVRCHHAVWAMTHGEYPPTNNGTVVDHINGIRSDNRPENLRLVSRSGNAMNSKPMVSSYKRHSKWKGVTWDAARQKWKCQIRPHKGAPKIQKRFDDEREAAEEYMFLALEHHGEYARFE